jgi:hypothetical protein
MSTATVIEIGVTAMELLQKHGALDDEGVTRATNFLSECGYCKFQIRGGPMYCLDPSVRTYIESSWVMSLLHYDVETRIDTRRDCVFEVVKDCDTSGRSRIHFKNLYDFEHWIRERVSV